jgi:hypothetical protein
MRESGQEERKRRGFVIHSRETRAGQWGRRGLERLTGSCTKGSNLVRYSTVPCRHANGVTVLPMRAGKFQDLMDRGALEHQSSATDDRSLQGTRRKAILLLFMFGGLEDVWCAALQRGAEGSGEGSIQSSHKSRRLLQKQGGPRRGSREVLVLQCSSSRDRVGATWASQAFRRMELSACASTDEGE